MQALIKKGTRESPVWGFVLFQPKGWKIKESPEKPFIFTDSITDEYINELTGNQMSNDSYELVSVDVVIK